MSIVEQTLDQARRSVALALAGAALAGSTLILGGVLVERLWLSRGFEAALERHALAQRVAADAQLANEQLTWTSQMAVATGARRWVDDYDVIRPQWLLALAQAKTLASPAAAQAFDARVSLASDELESMRESAFEAVTVGAADVARAIFEGARYLEHTRLLGEATRDFTAAAVDATRDEIAQVQQRSLLIGAAAAIGALLLEYAIWRLLRRRLARSRGFFLDAEERIQRLATRDLLTGLANRAGLRDAMAVAIARAGREGRGLALLMIDLDRFKPVNDRHGHLVGDRVLDEVGRRLMQCVRAGEAAARYGGDEFVVLIENADPRVARAAAERILRSLSESIRVDALNLGIGSSIGIARLPEDAQTGDELLRKADSALYRAKQSERGGLCFYDRGLDEAVAERAALEQRMREGLARGEFVPYYQPIVALANRQVHSLEVLCRWKHPERGVLAPAQFIALAEESGLIGPMTLSLLRQACVDLHHFPSHWRLTINVAPQQMQDKTLATQLLAVLREHGVAPTRLDVELTETALVGDTARAREVIQSLQASGMTVTLDDFGTGYSNLSYLAEMTFDKIKIDRSFVHTLHDRPQSAKIVAAIVGLSRSLGVQTVAEGIESERDATALLKLGCVLAQGYLYSPPVPASELPQLREAIRA